LIAVPRGGYVRYVALTNNVFDRVKFSLGNGSDANLTAYARNNRGSESDPYC
jgi:hypothetical protein